MAIGDLQSVITAIRDLAQAKGALLALLFGSLSRGTATARSDIDLIIVERTDAPFLKRLDHYYDDLADRLQTPVDLFVYTPEEFRKMKNGPFVRRALAEGIVVYGSATV